MSKWVQHEYSVSSRLIDEQTTVTVRSSGDAELTRRLSKWLGKIERSGCVHGQKEAQRYWRGSFIGAVHG